VIVTDNEGDDRTRGICEAAGAAHDLDVRYLVEPRRGISFARNRGLDAVGPDADFIAMIDDDERPEPDWLEELLLAQAATGADVVQGRVLPAFAPGTPAWIRDGDFFGYPAAWMRSGGRVGGRVGQRLGDQSKQAWQDLHEVEAAATNTVLVRAAAVVALGLRFKSNLALTGGEDALFFRKLRAAGHRIVYAERAVVWEDVPLSRASLAYVWRRAYADGSKRLAAKLWAKGPDASAWRVRGRLAVRAVAQAASAGAWLLAQAVRRPRGPALLAHGLVELANALGTLAACAGFAYEHDRRAGEAPPQPATAQAPLPPRNEMADG
jgi:glycosyltransferase involved in cell wall biosynthesis